MYAGLFAIRFCWVPAAFSFRLFGVHSICVILFDVKQIRFVATIWRIADCDTPQLAGGFRISNAQQKHRVLLSPLTGIEKPRTISWIVPKKLQDRSETLWGKKQH